MEKISGRVVFKLDDNINTDKILPGRYLTLTGDDELATHCFEGHIKDWNASVKKGDFLVAGENFGCGSSREHAPAALRGSGIVVVIAESFGRIFYRNAIALGLPVIAAKGISHNADKGDILEIDPDTGKILNPRTKATISFDPFPDFIQAFLDAGGLAKFVRKQISGEQAATVSFTQ
jgi:3-isopropylmalate/(R)-2-methylmalate dehydratase small subunit